MIQFLHLAVDSNVAEVEERVQAAVFQLQNNEWKYESNEPQSIQYSKVLSESNILAGRLRIIFFNGMFSTRQGSCMEMRCSLTLGLLRSFLSASIFPCGRSRVEERAVSPLAELSDLVCEMVELLSACTRTSTRAFEDAGG